MVTRIKVAEIAETLYRLNKMLAGIKYIESVVYRSFFYSNETFTKQLIVELKKNLPGLNDLKGFFNLLFFPTAIGTRI
ncbi:hypothetical protein C8D94_1011221 [Marinirhabdus gelatinilytica]|uniref:Uncharacterized protein n=1 Tax=Marinirhabdus gelatinilytica TaxID=1703343 RepID=A0A370QLT0_9FLAO|nr:hypothetical protein C8D94_1011221 [Marinirhabdus gelatinilytica]